MCSVSTVQLLMFCVTSAGIKSLKIFVWGRNFNYKNYQFLNINVALLIEWIESNRIDWIGGIGLEEKKREEDEYWEGKGVFQSSLPNVREHLFC